MDDKQRKRENKWVLVGLVGSVLACAIAMVIFIYASI
jgi:hypothetical protein